MRVYVFFLDGKCYLVQYQAAYIWKRHLLWCTYEDLFVCMVKFCLWLCYLSEKFLIKGCFMITWYPHVFNTLRKTSKIVLMLTASQNVLWNPLYLSNICCFRSGWGNWRGMKWNCSLFYSHLFINFILSSTPFLII